MAAEQGEPDAGRPRRVGSGRGDTDPGAGRGAGRGSGGEGGETPDRDAPGAARGKVWLISGASRGIGLALARRVLAAGGTVVAGCRRPDDLEAAPGLLPVRLDVTEPAEAEAAVATALRELGGLDVVANVAGTGLVGAVEETPADLARSLFEVNFWGAVNVLAAALPVLREQRGGDVIQVSSLSGRVAAPGVGFYAASKFALEGLSESLHAELRPLGVRLTIVEPGGVRTDWAGSSLWRTDGIPDYAGTAGATRDLLARVDGQQASGPEQVAAAIVALVESEDPPRRAPVTADAVERIAAWLSLEAEALEAWRAAHPTDRTPV